MVTPLSAGKKTFVLLPTFLNIKTDTVGQSLEKEFLVDDTAITTTYISRKLDALEKMVRKGAIPGAPVSNFTNKETPKNK